MDTFVTAWERACVPALLKLLAYDAGFAMPPPAWFDGREHVGWPGWSWSGTHPATGRRSRFSPSGRGTEGSS